MGMNASLRRGPRHWWWPPAPSNVPTCSPGNDLPGVMLSGAVRRLINLYAIKPGERAVVFTGNPEGEAAAADLTRVGVDVVDVVDARTGGQLVRAKGGGSLSAAEIGGGRTVKADLLVTSVGWTTSTSLLNMAGCTTAYSTAAARFLPTDLPDNVMAAGGIVGDGTTDDLVAHGGAVGQGGRRPSCAAGQEPLASV